jgi:protein TonB
MQDPVADVLGERAALEGGKTAGILFSFLLHGALAAAVYYAATHTHAPQVVSVLNIRFSQAKQTVSGPALSATAAAPAPKVVKPAAPRIESPAPQPPKKAAAKKPVEKGTVPYSLFGKSSKKGSESPETRALKPPVTGSAQMGTGIGTAEPGVQTAALEGGDFPYTMYLERMKTKIGSNWFRPQSGDAVVVVYFAIERDGTIRDAKVETSSGNGMADRAALRAVLESSPLPPLPFGYNGTYLGVHLTFR